MDPRQHHPTQQNKHASPYGFDLTQYVEVPDEGASAHAAATRAVTHGGIYPGALAVEALALPDRAALEALARRPQLSIVRAAPEGHALRLYMNTMGRLHIRPASAPPVAYGEDDRCTDLGYVRVDAATLADIGRIVEDLEIEEHGAFLEVKSALDAVHGCGGIGEVLEAVIDHIEHVESVCFYVRDRFFALIERFVNLIDDKRNPGFLTSLRGKPYDEWDRDQVLVVAGLHALFLSGRSVRFEEFNGSHLTALRLVQRLREIGHAYEQAGCEVSIPEEVDLFERARLIRQQTLCAVGKPWLRYRWIYGLNFQKTERLLSTHRPDEPQSAWWNHFADDYRELVSHVRGDPPGEHEGMALLAHVCLARDVAGVPCDRGSSAARGWLEYLMEKTVASAVQATASDYGMSSSLRDVSRLVVYDDSALIDIIHSFTPQHFFTCFVSQGLVGRLGQEEADAVAAAVQKRMMFNRWHFVPGNLERPLIRSSRHWYYPPLIPDIAVHADMHRAAHNKARVKFSVRSPGPDMSRPALTIGGQRYRGFYDVRVVRMEGEGYTTEDMLRVRRRTLWLEAVYAAWTAYLMSPNGRALQVQGFQVGRYLDLPLHDSPARPHAPERANRELELRGQSS